MDLEEVPAEDTGVVEEVPPTNLLQDIQVLETEFYSQDFSFTQTNAVMVSKRNLNVDETHTNAMHPKDNAFRNFKKSEYLINEINFNLMDNVHLEELQMEQRNSIMKPQLDTNDTITLPKATEPEIVTLIIGGREQIKVQCMLDSGSTHTYMTYSLYEMLKGDFILGKNKVLMSGFNASKEIASLVKCKVSCPTLIRNFKEFVIAVAPEAMSINHNYPLRIGRDLQIALGIKTVIPSECYGIQTSNDPIRITPEPNNLENKKWQCHDDGMKLIQKEINANLLTYSKPCKFSLPKLDIPEHVRRNGIFTNQ